MQKSEEIRPLYICYFYPHAKQNASYLIFYVTEKVTETIILMINLEVILNKRVYRLTNPWVETVEIPHYTCVIWLDINTKDNII